MGCSVHSSKANVILTVSNIYLIVVHISYQCLHYTTFDLGLAWYFFVVVVQTDWYNVYGVTSNLQYDGDSICCMPWAEKKPKVLVLCSTSVFSTVTSEKNVMYRQPNTGSSNSLKPDFTRVQFIKKAVQEYIHVRIKPLNYLYFRKIKKVE